MGLTDLRQHFRGHIDWGSWTWSQLRQGCRITSLCDYILADNREDFCAMRTKQPRGFDSDHRLIYVKLTLQSNSKHRSYMRSRRNYPTLGEGTINAADKIMVELTEATKHANKQTISNRTNSWISERSWNLVDAKAEARRTGQTARALELEKIRKKSFAADREKVLDNVADEISAMHAANKTEAAFQTLQTWYKKQTGHQSKPTPSMQKKSA
jgi:acetylornithine deacetylase/succinyl-diaminopimelate desuccinylase-like protein